MRHLVAKGLTLVARNWRGRTGEIDLVFDDDDTLVFVEVKARSSARCGAPEESVDRRKLAQLRRVAAEYLAREEQRERSCRFDVVAVSLAGSGPPEVQHFVAVEL